MGGGHILTFWSVSNCQHFKSRGFPININFPVSLEKSDLTMPVCHSYKESISQLGGKPVSL